MSRHTAAMLAALSITAGPAQADETQHVRCAEVAFSQTVENQDRAGFKASIHPDARFIGSAVQRGPDEVFEDWAPFFEAEGPRIKLNVPHRSTVSPASLRPGVRCRQRP